MIHQPLWPQTGFGLTGPRARLATYFRAVIILVLVGFLAAAAGIAAVRPSRAHADVLAWQWVPHTMSSSKDWGGIAISSDGTHVAVAERYGGSIYTSADGGVTWSNRISAGSLDWRAIASSADGAMLVAAERGYIYTSTDGGATWTQRRSAADGTSLSCDWGSVASSADGMTLAAAERDGYIYLSTDGGATWVRQVDAGDYVWNEIVMSADGSMIVASSSFSPVVLRSSDRGRSWTTLVSADTTTTGGLQFMSMSGDGMTIVGASNGGWVYISTNGGVSWGKTDLGYDHWTDISVSPDGATILVVGNDLGRIVVSTDGGNHWTSRSSPMSQAYGNVLAASMYGSRMFMAVKHGRFYTSTDRGATWQERAIPAGQAWTSVSLSRDGARISAASSGGFLQTSADAGVTWAEHVGAGFGARSLAASEDGTRLAAADAGTSILTSLDGGSTWTERIGSGKRNWSAIVSSSDGTRFAATVTGGYVYTSGDGGSTWIERTGAGTLVRSIAGSADLSTLIVAPPRTSRGYLLTSADNGATWVTRTSAGRRYWSAVASSADGMRLVAADTGGNAYVYVDGQLTLTVVGGYLYTSTDGGATWLARTGPGLRDWRSVSVSADGLRYVAVSYGGPVYVSVDGGVRWMEQTELGAGGWVATAISPDATHVAVAVNNGAIYTVSYAGFPSEPTVSGPASARARDTTTFSLSAMHPADRPIRFRIDWNDDGLADEYVPAVGYAASPAALDVAHLWSAAGSYAFKVQAEDDSGALSLWSPYTILVNPAKPAVILTASSATYHQGGIPVVLTWSSQDANACTSADFSVSGTSGSVQVTPSNTRMYTISCTGAGGTAEDSETVSYVCTPSNMCSGSDVVNSCTGALVQGCEHGCTAGSCVIPQSPTFSVFTATDATGETFDATGHLQIRPSLVRPGATARVYWNVSDVSSCAVTEDNASITDSWTGVASGVTGKTTSPIQRRTAYTLSCTGLDSSTFQETQYVNLTPAWREQ